VPAFKIDHKQQLESSREISFRRKEIERVIQRGSGYHNLDHIKPAMYLIIDDIFAMVFILSSVFGSQILRIEMVQAGESQMMLLMSETMMMAMTMPSNLMTNGRRARRRCHVMQLDLMKNVC